MVDNINQSLTDYIAEIVNRYDLNCKEDSKSSNYILASKVDPSYAIEIDPTIRASRLSENSAPISIGGLTFGDIYFVDATDATFRLLITKLITGDYKIYDTPVNKYLKHIFFFVESNNKSIKFYDNGSEIRDFDYRATDNSYPLSYYRRWPGIK